MLKTKTRKRKAKSLSQLKKQAWVLFSELVRRKDITPAGSTFCYTCGKADNWKYLQCGHAIGGRHNAVLFDEEICRPQCPVCNVWKRGNYQAFITRLIEENGFAWWQAKLAASKLTIKYSRADLEAKLESYKERLRGLE